MKETNKRHNSIDNEFSPSDQELVGLLQENTDIIKRYPELLAILEVPHQCGAATSLIEKQVVMLRKQNRLQDRRLRELLDIARENERLAKCRHHLAINLLATQDLDEVISTVLAVLSDELSAEYTAIRLISNDSQRINQNPGLFIDSKDSSLNIFKIMLDNKNTVCGKATAEQKQFLFGGSADRVGSVAVVPLVAGANLGLIGLGALDDQRFNSSMGTDFLSQTGDLVSAALAAHL